MNKLHYSIQYGFRRNHSNEHAALELVDRMITDTDKGAIPFAILIYLSKAFEPLGYMPALSYYGVQGNALALFQSYLSNRKQYEKIDNVE